jgi:UDP-N-acetylmuramate dehydrogenase
MKELLELKKRLNCEIRFDEPLKYHTTFKIGGPCIALAIPESTEDIQQVVNLANQKNIPLYVIGNGSNLLVHDEGVAGIVIKIGNNLKKVTIEGEKVNAHSGIPLSDLAKQVAAHGLGGLEFGIGIPGTLGGAIAMNAGAEGWNISDAITAVKIMNRQGETYVLEKQDLHFDYRRSRIKGSGNIVLEAELLLRKEEPGIIKKKMQTIMEKREHKFPLEYPSAGSIFKNPENYPASYLIDKCGLKGTREGDAEISRKHAGFIVNLGNATYKDVSSLIQRIRKTVKDKFNISLELEVVVL